METNIDDAPFSEYAPENAGFQKKKFSLKLSPTAFISSFIVLAGIVAGYIIVSQPVNRPNLAAGQPPVGESCSEATGTCSMDPDARDKLIGDHSARWTWTFLIRDGAGNEVDRSGNAPGDQGQRYVSTKKFSGGSYTCDIELYRDGVRYSSTESDACRAIPQGGSLLCENCACHLFGDLAVKPIQPAPDTYGRMFAQSKWNGITPPPSQCTDVGQSCYTIRVFSERNHENNQEVNNKPPVEIVPPSPYSCANPHPTIVIHQTKGGEARKYEFVAYDKNGNEIEDPACRGDLTYSCPSGEGSCGLFNDPDTIAPPSQCNSNCDFTITATGQGGGALGDNGLKAGLCADPSQYVSLSMSDISNAGPWVVSFGDDIDKNDDRQYNTRNAKHKYFDYGAFKIVVQCLETNQVCRKVLKMGCEHVTPSPSPSPSPTPPVCPVLTPIKLQFELQCQGACGISPTPTP